MNQLNKKWLKGKLRLYEQLFEEYAMLENPDELQELVKEMKHEKTDTDSRIQRKRQGR